MLSAPAPVDDSHEDALLAAAVALSRGRFAILSGAGISTPSGIPDYRGPETRARVRTPLRFAQFMASDDARRRYWARATLGWPRVRDAQPNAAHVAAARAEADGRCVGIITQNVDGLHERAAAREGREGRVVPLHGVLREVVCLTCGALCDRDALHGRLLAHNPTFAALLASRTRPTAGASDAGDAADMSGASAPDGDVDLHDDVVAGFTTVACARCGGALKPRVVFFGENVAPDVLAAAWRVLDDATALLVVGTSLEVFSGRRFVEEAARRRLPVVLVNATATRADALATVHVRARAEMALPALLTAGQADGRSAPRRSE